MRMAAGERSPRQNRAAAAHRDIVGDAEDMSIRPPVATSQRGVRGVLLMTLMDVVAAALVSLLIFRLFGASSGDDTNPPVCYNASGGVVSCSLTPSILMLPTFVIVLMGLLAWQTRRRRSRRN